MERIVHISTLASSTVTRARGDEAYEKLKEYLVTGNVEIDLSYVEPLSLSFLDQIVFRLLEDRRLEKVTFIAPKPEIQRKLEQVASIRETDILFRAHKGEPHRKVQPKVETTKIVLRSHLRRNPTSAHAA